MLIKNKIEGKIHYLSFITVLEDWVAFPLVISNSSEELHLTLKARSQHFKCQQSCSHLVYALQRAEPLVSICSTWNRSGTLPAGGSRLEDLVPGMAILCQVSYANWAGEISQLANIILSDQAFSQINSGKKKTNPLILPGKRSSTFLVQVELKTYSYFEIKNMFCEERWLPLLRRNLREDSLLWEISVTRPGLQVTNYA